METRTGRLSQTPAAQGAYDLTSPKAHLFAGRHEAQLAKAVGITQFGVNHLVLEPGSQSSLRHWHEGEDEFVYVLEGDLVLVDETGEHPLRAGDFAGFPAGIGNAHHLVNRSLAPASALVVGSRKRGVETIHYPDDGAGPATVRRDDQGNRTQS